MRTRMMLALFLAGAAIGPAAAQQAPEAGGIRSETQRRLAEQEQMNQIPWDWVGLLGLFGLLGLRRRHSEDGYHPTDVE